jgi:hypothetical protein
MAVKNELYFQQATLQTLQTSKTPHSSPTRNQKPETRNQKPFNPFILFKPLKHLILPQPETRNQKPFNPFILFKPLNHLILPQPETRNQKPFNPFPPP